MPGNFNSLPASVAASWPAPNYVDPVRRTWLPAFSGSFLAATTLLIAARFYLRSKRLAGGFGLDDVFVFIGWLFSIGLTTVAIIGVEWYGLDRHTWDAHRSQFSGAALMGWFGQVTFLISTCSTKISILLFYRRMVNENFTQRWLNYNYAAIAFNAAYFVGVFLAYCFICTPLESYWLAYNLSYDVPYTCVDGKVLVLFVGCLSIVSDLIAVILPMLVLRSRRMEVPRVTLITSYVIFAMGLLVSGSAVARIYSLWALDNTYDTSWVGFNLFVWTVLEADLALFCACLPSSRVFVRRYFIEPWSPPSQSTTSSTVPRNQSTQLSCRLSDDDLFGDKFGAMTMDENTLVKMENGLSFNASKPLDWRDVQPRGLVSVDSHPCLETRARVENESYL